MNTASKMSRMRACALALCALCGGVASSQAEALKLAPAYEGRWDNLEEPINGWMRIAIDKVNPDGTVEGKYTRTSRVCAADQIAMKGKIEGDQFHVKPDFGSDFKCKDTAWKYQIQADGTLIGPGESYYRLKAELKPVVK
jgi:hypothetical protein